MNTINYEAWVQDIDPAVAHRLRTVYKDANSILLFKEAYDRLTGKNRVLDKMPNQLPRGEAVANNPETYFRNNWAQVANNEEYGKLVFFDKSVTTSGKAISLLKLVILLTYSSLKEISDAALKSFQPLIMAILSKGKNESEIFSHFKLSMKGESDPTIKELIKFMEEVLNVTNSTNKEQD